MKAGVILLFLSDFCDPCGLQPTRFLCPWDYPGKNTGVGCHFLLLGILPPQGLNLHLLLWQADSLLPSHLGSLSGPLDVFVSLSSQGESVRLGVRAPTLTPTSAEFLILHG